MNRVGMPRASLLSQNQKLSAAGARAAFQKAVLFEKDLEHYVNKG